ncbi:MAG: hypothetical protein JSW10_10940 [Pseudomonadota bacterium]|nr:MAG: hypothetical protein JSW10_10940 [Pseudomonadota bacterium]
MPEQPSKGEPSQFLVESLRASTRSLRFLFLLILALSFLVGYSIFQQPWWIIERVGWGIDTFERIEKLHRDFRNEPALQSAALEKFELLKGKALSLAVALERLNEERPQEAAALVDKLKASLKEEQPDYLEALLDDDAWEEVSSVFSHIRTKDAEQLSIEYLALFAGYFYPDLWQDLLKGTLALLAQLDEYSVGLDPNYAAQGVVSATLGHSWQSDLNRWDLGPWAVIRNAKLGVEWEDRLYQLPSLERVARSIAVLAAFCDNYDIDPCSLNFVRREFGEKTDESVLRNLEVPYLGKSVGNLQIVLAFPFVAFTLVLMLYLQIRRRKALLQTLLSSQIQHDVMLLDAPTIFANIELFGGTNLKREERAASTGLRLMVVLALAYTFIVVTACVFYVGQEVHFDVMLVQVADEIRTGLNSVGLSVSLPFLQFPWIELIAVILWIVGAFLTGTMGAWITWLIWKELRVSDKTSEQSA